MINQNTEQQDNIPDQNEQNIGQPQIKEEDSKISSDVEDKEKVSANTERQKKLVTLPLGIELTTKGINKVLSRSPTKVIVVAGAPDSGKTTLISAIYSQFHFGPFAGYLFAGSETLLGFERRSHLSRISSRLNQPDTERTKDTDVKMLHLKLCGTDLKRPISEILLSDISGESFRDVPGSSELTEDLKWITRADRFILLIDGDKLLSNEHKHKARALATLILRACLDNNLIKEGIDIDIILSKYDLIKKSSKQKGTLRFWEEIKKEIKQRLSQYDNNLRFIEIGSRGLEDDPELVSRLIELFSLWVKEPDKKEEDFSKVYNSTNSEIVEPMSKSKINN